MSKSDCIKEVFHEEFLEDGWANGNAAQEINTYATAIISKLLERHFGKTAANILEHFTGKAGLVTEMTLFFHKIHEAKHGGDPITSQDWAALGHAALDLAINIGQLAGRNWGPIALVSFAVSVIETLAPFAPCFAPEPKEYPNTDPATKVKSPLAIDLDGDGIATYALKNGVYFDIDSDGFAEKTAWLNAKDAFLAIDRNKNGIIDGASELFGDSDKAANGFEIKVIIDNRFNQKLIINDDLFVQSA